MELRVRNITVILTLAFLLLASRAAQLQILQGEELEVWAHQQRLRLLNVSAPRGTIYDRHGRALATNRPAFTVSLVPTGEGFEPAVISRLSEILTIPEESIRSAIDNRALPYAPVLIKIDLTAREHTLIAERMRELPGVRVDVEPARHYPYDTLACHVLGYTLQISREELAVFFERSGRPYRNDDLVGKSAVERYFEFQLQGKDGALQVEVDARGRLVNTLGRQEPEAGADVHLTIDAGLQMVAEKALVTTIERLRQGYDPQPYDPEAGRYVNLWDEGIFLPLDPLEPEKRCEQAGAGAAVVLEVRTGEVLAMASCPGFDPNQFATAPLHLPGTEGAKQWADTWAEISSPGGGHPLTNRAIASIAAPGSVFKPVTALAGVRAGLVDPRHTVVCTGVYPFMDTSYDCWQAHGRVDFTHALAASCNTYFYQLGLNLGIDRIEAEAQRLGLGERTGLLGVPSYEEESGIRPGREWKEATLGQPWYEGETLMSAIGQTYHAYTPLQVANYVATIANGGTRYRPYLASCVQSPGGETLSTFGPEVISSLDIAEGGLQLVREGMEAAAAPGGTAFWRFWDYPKWAQVEGEIREVGVAAKTGTAQVGAKNGLEDSHGWFVLYAPCDEPEIAVAVFVEHGGGGSQAGAPVARAIVEHYFGFDTAGQRWLDEQ